MNLYTVNNKWTIVRGDKDAEARYRNYLSALIIEKHGAGPYPANKVTEILSFCQQYFIEAFQRICREETSFTFYEEVFVLHEQATALRKSEFWYQLPEGLDTTYIARYRRILKMILEEACLIDLQSGEPNDAAFRERTHDTMNDLLFLGQHLFDCGESLAEQIMVEDCTDISFDEKGRYVFSRRHHYEHAFQFMGKRNEELREEPIVDKRGYTDFIEAVRECWGIDYENLMVFFALYTGEKGLKPGDCVTLDEPSLWRVLEQELNAPIVHWKAFLDGLTLRRNNKLPLSELVKRPHHPDRYLSRPLLIWQVNGAPYAVMGWYGWDEAQQHHILNAIPWGKMPKEWETNVAFTSYKNRKKEEHDTWLDDKVEEAIGKTGQYFDRSVKKLRLKNGAISLEETGNGEIDFIIVSTFIKKIFYTECKHLQGRYDMTNFLNDYSHFTKDGKDGYNSRLTRKVEWAKLHLKEIEEHFRLKYNDPALSLEGYTIEGIFIVNTPTFYMHNSTLRIYTYGSVADVITGQYKDPELYLMEDSADYIGTFFIRYPYFTKKKLFIWEDEDGDCKVDKYGNPIKPS